jgi:hypothetical protein
MYLGWKGRWGTEGEWDNQLDWRLSYHKTGEMIEIVKESNVINGLMSSL